jgi:hypothetical protein
MYSLRVMRFAVACCEVNELSVHAAESVSLNTCDLIVIMGSLSTSHPLMGLEQVAVFNKVLDENIGEFSLDDDILFDSDYSG